MSTVQMQTLSYDRPLRVVSLSQIIRKMSLIHRKGTNLCADSSEMLLDRTSYIHDITKFPHTLSLRHS